MNLIRSVINSLLPEGRAWEPAAGSDYDLLLDGMAENYQAYYEDLKLLGCIRCPQTTPILSDLEKEYGVLPSALATEQERRDRLEAFKYGRANTGAYDVLQQKLRDSGFNDVYVHENSPAVDPAIFLAQAFSMTCGDGLQCGDTDAYCASIGGELVVNGDLFENIPMYSGLCGETGVCCGGEIFAGDFSGYKTTSLDAFYQVPTNPGYWPLIFFVGGIAARDINGYLTDINIYAVPQERRLEFRRIILKFKPMFSWGGLIVSYD